MVLQNLSGSTDTVVADIELVSDFPDNHVSQPAFAEVKRLLPVPNAGGEGLEVTRTVSNGNRKKE